jgi:hypothetical protein
MSMGALVNPMFTGARIVHLDAIQRLTTSPINVTGPTYVYY